jgi:hypothetical protein
MRSVGVLNRGLLRFLDNGHEHVMGRFSSIREMASDIERRRLFHTVRIFGGCRFALTVGNGNMLPVFRANNIAHRLRCIVFVGKAAISDGMANEDSALTSEVLSE